MWASCCNWFCVDNQTMDEPEHNPRRQAYTNAGYNSQSPPAGLGHTCRACGSQFENPLRKHVCVDCKKDFCTACSVQPENSPKMCHTCQRFRATDFERGELMKLKVKDLRDYLQLHEISMEMCREKSDLVDLVLGQRPPIALTHHMHIPVYRMDNPEQQYFIPNAHTETTASTSRDDPPPYGANSPEQSRQANLLNTETTVENQNESVPPVEDETESIDSEEIAAPGRHRASLSDLTCVEDIEALTVRQLKEILARNFVDYKGCCEKWELMERVTRLYNEQKDLQNQCGNESSGVDDNLCKICMDSPIDCVLLECGHMVTCTKCGKRMSECPICRQFVIRAVHVFKS
ncbi:E3 ubiquitin-protein ligase rififylin [Chiloscyllium plagiosum]|uniref:E3 ubiquitin-protein ligase rififylin n=1 Tax=Chiloscyllium plagiosum TaxID=36176 RepID=UPI001CB7BFAB|nr:E3 ubiquitin-protein ligase rififylin [Chiloscyllium plagiosum]XP_043574738.1 E3 ubiquitin-protein ligase rififylin [Chiloscyllium plagiosum]XP_043574740.1 E3 ubiquitin-protein ligase rififylin [Chiloscyllium plagiosum]XP_043574741.1 E3 ubiquitin-protein ligase rififylin [Chiloscyllium plagiosum]